MSAIIKVENVTKCYKKSVALDDVSIELQKKLVYGLIGPNGSGKTTLMKVILGFLKYKGKVFIDGSETYNEKVKLNYVPEIIRFYEYLTGEQVVMLISEMQGYKADDVLPLFNKNAFLIGYGDRKKLIREHSKGNLRKLMLLQALSVPSDVLMLDEPFSGLDPISVEKVKSLFLQKKEGNCTLLINTHLFDVAKSICDVLIFIKDGEIIHKETKERFNTINLIKLFDTTDL